ncbi:MAG: GAF domain-containing protein [Bryobacterales bacterium]|nr:GAF domain-containing protein [Bryobacterales bacterium]
MATKRSSRVRFRERAELLDFLLEVSSVTGETLDLDRILGNVADIVRNVIPHDLFAILLYSERLQVLSIRYSRGHRDELVTNLHIKLGEGITGAAGQTRQPVLVDDVTADRRYLNAMDAVRSELAVPMITRGKLVGVLDLQSTARAAFNEQDRALLQLIAARIATAIENARLYRRVEQSNRTQRTLTHLAHEFSSILDVDALLDKIAKSIHGLINYDAFTIMLIDETRSVMKSRFSQRYDEKLPVATWPLDRGITGAVARGREPVLARDTSVDPRYHESIPGIHSEVAVPLIVNDRVIGVMDLESTRVNYFNDEHVRVLTLIAPQIATAIENARLYEELALRERRIQQDLEAARQLQSVILPVKPPEAPNLDIAFWMKPARNVTGDLYDFFEFGDGDLLVAFGDSAGKGAAAALFGAMFSGLLRTIAPRRRSPALLLKTLNDTLMERAVETRFVTLLVMLWRPSQKTFTIANAGATPPLVCRQGRIISPVVAGVPVGLLDEGIEYEEKIFESKPGDLIVLFSDGVQDQTGATNPEEYAKTRLPALLPKLARRSAKEAVGRIAKDLRKHRGSNPMIDDQTLLVMKVQ